MHDGTSSQIKHILPHPPVAGTAALPVPNMGQSVFHGDALAQLRTSLGGLLAFAQLLQQGFIGMNADAAARRTRGTTRPQRTGGTGGRGKLHYSPRLKRHRLAARTAQFVPFPIQLEGRFGEIQDGPYWPRFAENGQGIVALLDQSTRGRVPEPCG